MSKPLAAYAARLGIERSLGLLLYLVGAGWVLDGRATAWFVVYFLAIGSGIWLAAKRPDTMARRADLAATKDTTPVWDKVILALFWLLAYFVVYYVAGVTNQSAPVWPLTIALGLAIYIASCVLTTAALMENAHAESVARLQPERAQTVCATGPYAWVRHPMYAAIIMWCVAIVLVFPCIPVALISVAVAALIVCRTLLEERMLVAGLPGYDEYRHTVRWRLIPFVF